MSGPSQRFPERLRMGGGSELERRLLRSALREQPSRSLSERMANGIGVSAHVLLAAPKSVRPRAPSKLAFAARAALPWLAGAAVAAAAGGALVSLRPKPSPAPIPAAVAALPVPSEPPRTVAAPAEPEVTTVVPEADPASATAAAPHSRSAASAADLRAQITLIDGARAAVSAGAGERALAILRDYQSKYGAGSFRPEANALKIEALVALGRDAEAHALAQRFVAEYRGSRLAARVSRIVGLEPR